MSEGAAKIKARMINVSKERRWFRCAEPPIAPFEGAKEGTAGFNPHGRVIIGHD